MKRYNLVLPTELYEAVEKSAQDRHTTFAEMLRRFIRLGLLAVQLEDSPNAALIIREGQIEKHILLL